MFAGDTLLADIPSDVSKPAYVIPFSENGIEPSIHFDPHIHSSPREGWRETTFGSAESYIDAEPAVIGSSPIQRPMAGRQLAHRLWDMSSMDGAGLDRHEVEEIIGLPNKWHKDPLWFLKYIDDGLGGEKLCNANAKMHLTTNRTVGMIHAKDSKNFLRITTQNATRIGMKINAEKTQMLCISVTPHNELNTYININEYDQISGGEAMKILGFVFGRKPTAEAHVNHMTKKFYTSLWVLRHMGRVSGNKETLTKKFICNLYGQ